MDKTDEFSFTPWTTEGAARLRAASAEAATALLSHAETLGELTDKSDVRELFEASDRLLTVLLAVAEAQFAYTGNHGPLGLLDGPREEYSDDDGVEPAPVDGISVLSRSDYRVSDVAAVLEGGRKAYLRVWPEDTEAQARADVTTIGRALYQILHDTGSWDGVTALEGLEPTGTAVLVVASDETLGPDPDGWPEALFEHEPDKVLYVQSDVYAG